MSTEKLRGVVALVALCASVTAAGQEGGVEFSHKDWEVVCDNTLTCRMAGYSHEVADGGGSVLITRAAGPDSPLQGEVTLADMDDSVSPRVLTLQINGKVMSELKRSKKETYPLTQTQIHALLAAAKNDGEVVFDGGTKSFALSGAGLSAVLLKMDDVQGRVGTPGALIRKGNKPEASVKPALPMPVVRAAKVSKTPPRDLTESEVARLRPMLRTKGGNCEFEDPNHAESMSMNGSKFTLTLLDDHHAFISTRCMRHAYQESQAYWTIDGALKGKPRFLIVGDELYYENGVISGSSKGRGLADCMSGNSWVWNGNEFVQTSSWRTGMCRLIHGGGTWHLPTLVTEVKTSE